MSVIRRPIVLQYPSTYLDAQQELAASPLRRFASRHGRSYVYQAFQKRQPGSGEVVSPCSHATGGERIPKVCQIQYSGGCFLGSNAFLKLSHVAIELGDEALEPTCLAGQVETWRWVAAPPSAMDGQTCIEVELLRHGLLHDGTASGSNGACFCGSASSLPARRVRLPERGLDGHS